MTDRHAFGGAILLAAVGLLVAYVLWPTPSSGLGAADTDGPNLVIDVAGVANGEVVIDLLQQAAPQHVERIVTLAKEGAYDGIVFHRVIEGFMAQTGDVKYGKRDGGEDLLSAGQGGSDLPDLPAEFSDISFTRGTVGMARSSSPDSANSQFFIMFADAPHLNGDYTVVGHVIAGMEIVDALKKGNEAANGAVEDADFMAAVSVSE